MIVHDTECGSQLKAASSRRVARVAISCAVGGPQLSSESGDLVVLGGEPGQRQVPEPLELADLPVSAGEPGAEVVDLGLAPIDASEPGIEVLPLRSAPSR